MSLSVDGFWKAGFWSQTFWAAGFWREGAQSGGGEIAGPRGAGPVLRIAQGERPEQRVYGRPQSTNTVRPGNRR